jgi:hypothetical protein
VTSSCGGTGAIVSGEDTSGDGSQGGAGGGLASAGKGGGGGKSSAAQGGGVGLDGGDVQSISLVPLQSVITIADGKASPAKVTYVVTATLKDGSQKGVTPAWSLDQPKLATIDAKGVLTPTGKAGGVVTVTATSDGVTASAKVTIKLSTTLTAAGLTVSDGDRTTLKGATTPDGSMKLSYPYDQTVFPPGILAPLLMWDGAGNEAGNDVFLVQLASSSGELDLFTTAPAPARVALDDAAWQAFTDAARGEAVKLRVARLAGGKATVVAQQTWTIASSSLRGTVYYWSNNLGRVLRIKPGAKAPEDFLAAAGVTDGCTTCHTVSANGATLVMGNGEGQGDSQASVFDLKTNTLKVSGRGRKWAMPALSPDGQYAILNDAPLPGGPGMGGGLFRVDTGAKLAGTPFDGTPLDMPVFAADGSALVYVDHTTHALSAYSASASSPPVFSGQRALVPQMLGAQGDPIAYPTVTPDGQWAVYHRGPLDSREGSADLFLASTTQAGAETSLAAASGQDYPFTAGDRDRHYSYEPTTAPLPAGGYFWAVFTSRRTYGNLRTGPAQDTAGTDGTKLLWMTAIDLHPEAGKDPSHPAFLLPGQDATTKNMRAFWVLDPCKAQGQGCQFGSDCCDGFCDPLAGSGPLVCSTGETGGQGGSPPCAQVGNKCESSADCCTKGSECINHFCSDPAPK